MTHAELSDEQWALVEAEIGDYEWARAIIDDARNQYVWHREGNWQSRAEQKRLFTEIKKAARFLSMNASQVVHCAPSAIQYRQELQARNLFDYVASGAERYILFLDDQPNPSNATDHVRDHLLAVLCSVWQSADRTIGRGNDPLTGKPGNPLIRFLIASTDGLFAEPLRPGQASGFITKLKRAADEKRPTRLM